MQSSELLCLGAGAAAFALLTCRRGPAAYRASTECSAYRAEVEDVDAASARRVVTTAPVFGAEEAPRTWTDAFDERSGGGWEDAFQGDAPAENKKKLPALPPKALPMMVEKRPGKQVGYKSANEHLKDELTNRGERVYKGSVASEPDYFA
jgi:hypothetical protein